jgi:glutamyl-tRNA synthetase
MTYATVRPRLEALGCDLGEDFWNAVRPNLSKLADVVEMARIVRGSIVPVIEDAAFAEAALKLLPETIDADAWRVWTEAVKVETGTKGKTLFMPLRLILTGQTHGPDMAAMIVLMGRETLVKRLKGEAG